MLKVRLYYPLYCIALYCIVGPDIFTLASIRLCTVTSSFSWATCMYVPRKLNWRRKEEEEKRAIYATTLLLLPRCMQSLSSSHGEQRHRLYGLSACAIHCPDFVAHDHGEEGSLSSLYRRAVIKLTRLWLADVRGIFCSTTMDSNYIWRDMKFPYRIDTECGVFILDGFSCTFIGLF